MTCTESTTGRGDRVYIYPANANCDIIPYNGNAVQHTITVAQGADIAANPGTPVVVTISALPTGVYIPDGAYVNFVSATGASVLAQVTTGAVATGTTITIDGANELIADGSTISWPPVFSVRESTGFNATSNLVTTSFFDDDGWDRNSVATFSATSDANGDFNQLDGAAWTVIEQAENATYNGLIYVVEFRAPNTTYAAGTRVVGQVVTNTIGIQSVANGRRTLNTQLTYTGKPDIQRPVAA